MKNEKNTKHKVEVIDYLRGFSILVIVIIHVIAWHDNAIFTVYTKLPILFNLRDFLEFSVVTIVICSGFSLYLSHNKLSLNFKDLFHFYRKRFKRILMPWWIFLIIFFSIHYIIKSIFGLELIDLSRNYILASFFMIGGIGFGWLVLLMLVVSLLFPFLKYLYTNINKIILFNVLTIAYVSSLILFEVEHIHVFHLSLDSISIAPLIIFTIPFILGWSIAYMIGFLLARFYNTPQFMKKVLELTLGFIGLFISVNVIYTILNFDKHLYLNKYPPTPEFLSFGLMATFILLTLFFSCKKFIHDYLKKLLSFFSSNSYWLFMWNALTLSFFIPFLALFEFNNIFLRLIIAIILNVLGVSLLVLLQKRLIKIAMRLKNTTFKGGRKEPVAQ